MKKYVIATILAVCLALCAIVTPRKEEDKQRPVPELPAAVAAPQPISPKSEELVVLTIAEPVERYEENLIPEDSVPEIAAPMPREKSPNSKSKEKQTTQPEATTESKTNDGSPTDDMVYVPGFGWIKNEGPNHALYAEDMYENGNKIGIMG